MSQPIRPLWVLSALLSLLLWACAPSSPTTEGAPQPPSGSPASSEPVPTAPPVATNTPHDTEPAAPTQSLEPQPASPIATASPETSGQQPQPSATGSPLPEPSRLPKRGQVAQEVPEDLIGEMVADLAARLQVRPEEITVVQAEAVTWNDGSLGCPEKGVYYLQVVTPGYQVVLSHGGVDYDYRASDSGAFRLCQGALPSPSAAPPTD